MPLSLFEPAMLPQDKPVILICQSGVRSAQVRRACQTIAGVVHYGPGITGWSNHGGTLVRG